MSPADETTREFPDWLKPGARVRFRQEVEIHGLGVFPAGAVGTVSSVHIPPDDPFRCGEPAAVVRMQHRFDFLEEWDNDLHVFTADGVGEMCVLYLEPFPLEGER